MCEKVSKYTETSLLLPKQKKELLRLIRSPFYLRHNELPTQTGKEGLIELVSDKRTVNDDKLVHVGICILQQSKLLFLRFVQFLRTYLKPGSFQTIYCGNFNFSYHFDFLKVYFRYRLIMLEFDKFAII